MKIHIETALIVEAFEKNGECPLCDIRRVVNERVLHVYANEGVMEDDTRARVNRMGFCPTHFQELLEADNKLGIALQSGTRLATLQKKLKLPKNPKEAAKLADMIDAELSTCAVCGIVEEHMTRYTQTIASMYAKETFIRDAIHNGKGFCLTHFAALLRAATHAGGEKPQFLAALYDAEERNLARLSEELQGFCDKFDYRYSDRPWGNSKDSVVRTIFKIRSNKRQG